MYGTISSESYYPPECLHNIALSPTLAVSKTADLVTQSLSIITVY